MIDFPNSPALNQVFTPPGVGSSWKWDGTKWIAQGGSGLFLPLTGGVLSGPGNLALGGAAIPSPVASPSILTGVFQILTAPGVQMLLLNNIYSDATNWRAVQPGGSSFLQINFQTLQFYTAPSVAAGAVASPTLRLQVDPTGSMTLTGNLTLAGNLAVGNATIPSPVSNPSILTGVYQILAATGGTNWMFLENNIYSDGTNWRVPQTGASAYLQLTNNSLLFYTAPSVAAGAIPSPALALTANSSGLLLGGGAIPSTVLAGSLFGVNQVVPPTNNSTLYLFNAYSDGTSYRYQATNPASLLMQGTGGLYLLTAPSGSALSVATMATKFQVDPNGNVALGGLTMPFPIPVAPFINAYQFLGLSAAAALFTHNLYYDGTNWRLYGANAGSLLQLSLGTMYLYSAPSGAAGSVPTLTQRLGVDTSGNLTVPGSIGLGTQLNIGGSGVMSRDATWTYLYDPNGGTALYLGGTGQNINYHGNGAHYFSSRGLSTTYVQFTSGGTYNNSGVWVAFSDIRTKTDIEDYTAGLEAIRALRPVSYRRNGRAQLPVSARKHLGLVAHEVEAIMPEIVLRETRKLDPEDEEPTELLATESHNVIYAMINAIQQLATRLEALEGAKPP